MSDFMIHHPIDRHFVNGGHSRYDRFGPVAPFRLSLEYKRDLLKRRAHKSRNCEKASENAPSIACPINSLAFRSAQGPD